MYKFKTVTLSGFSKPKSGKNQIVIATKLSKRGLIYRDSILPLVSLSSRLFPLILDFYIKFCEQNNLWVKLSLFQIVIIVDQDW